MEKGNGKRERRRGVHGGGGKKRNELKRMHDSLSEFDAHMHCACNNVSISACGD